MTVIQEIHVGDVGTKLRIKVYDVDVDGNEVLLDELASATDMILRVEKPDKTTAEFDMEFETDGSDGIAVYITQEGDIDQSGGWKFQGIFTLPDGKWSSNVVKKKVFPNLAAPPVA